MKHLWIMNLKSSILLFYYSPTSEKDRYKLNEYLISGLLSTMNIFSEVELEGKGVESIDMAGLRWVYLKDVMNNLLLVAADSKSANSDLMSARLDVIKKMFVKTFDIDAHFWAKGPIEIGQFEKFSITVQMVYDQWQVAE